MHKIIFILLTALALIFYDANAATTKKGGNTLCNRSQKIEYSNPVIIPTDTDSCKIELPITIKYGSMKRGEKLDINLTLFDIIDNKTDELGEVSFSTGNRYNKDQREKKRRGEPVSNPDFESKFGPRKPLVIIFSCMVPQRDWTLDATHLIIKQQLSKGNRSCNYGSVRIPVKVIK